MNYNFYNNNNNNTQLVNKINEISVINEISEISEISEINKINEINEINKIIILKKNFYCTNCNKKGHTYKKCLEPIISNGIISIQIENFDKNMIKNLELFINNNFTSKLYNNLNNKICEINNKIKFLMIQRKSSLGYLEFMRGRYNLSDDLNIQYLFEQMTQSEIDNIINKDFDNLWNDLWDINNIKNKNHYKEYIISRQKFYELKLQKIDFIKNINPKFGFNEWGFPKGRRELYENDMICAIREFEEETSIDEKKYYILENCKKIKENLIGTNGINYQHNYFLALLNTNKINANIINDDGKENKEIGDIRLMTYNECITVIRPYHNSKLKIIKTLYCLINDFIQNNFNQNDFNQNN